MVRLDLVPRSGAVCSVPASSSADNESCCRTESGLCNPAAAVCDGPPHTVAESEETALPMDPSGSVAPGTFRMHRKGHREGAVQEAQAPSTQLHQHFPAAIFKHIYWEMALSAPLLGPRAHPCLPRVWLPQLMHRVSSMQPRSLLAFLCPTSSPVGTPVRGPGLVRLEEQE